VRSSFPAPMVRLLHGRTGSFPYLALFVTVALLCSCSGGNTSAAATSSCSPNFAPGSQALLLARDQSLYERNMRTGRECKLLDAPAGKFITYPVWSPDGKQFVYIVDAPFQGDVTANWGDDMYIADDGGGNARLLLQHDKPGVQYESPTFTPDGKTIIYSYFYTDYDSSGNYQGQVYEARRIAVDGTPSADPGLPNVNGTNLCRDGSLMTYVDFDQTNLDSYGVWVSDANGQNARAVVTSVKDPQGNFQAYFAPTLSPDCKQIIFAAMGCSLRKLPGGPPSLFARALRLLAPQPAEAHGPPWDFWLVNVDGSGLQRVTHLNEDLPYPQWSDDGQSIVFVGTTGLFQMSPDGSNIKRIDNGAVHGQIAWRR